MEIRAAGLTDVGLKREGNEDAFSKDEANGLFIVADGMGGHLAGEVASRIAVEMISNSFQGWTKNETPVDELYGTPDASLTLLGNYLSSSIRLANRVVYEMAREYDQYNGMGTTVAVVHVTPSLIVAANAGDSRIYLIRGGEIERLSKDHTIVSEQVEMGVMAPEEAETSPLKHVLTRNLGSSEQVDVDVYEIEPSNGDRFVLCSDGLTDLVSDREILEMTGKETDPDELCRQLVKTALRRGGHDNTTVIAVFANGIAGAEGPPLKKLWGVFADAIIGFQKIIKKFKP
ncbi:MAG: Stp1/IreP family PP2C-type Ser/Thr phosphatase [Deltaproteobacteria bacterium]|nr:Stp1/IreP family PP2C-type Ser/Thr phosphatase [Deltaproteobacteria bacterium]